jgi:hypothetical protein
MTSETLAEIVADLKSDKRRFSNSDSTAIACRIEAAAKREREIADAKIADLQSRVKLWTDRSAELVKKCNEHYANAHKSERGNAAALRAALQTIHDRVNSLDEQCGVDPVEIRDIARAALAKPPRNCNRFDSYEQARSEWWKTEVLPRVYGVVSGAEKPFDEWLFDLATEQKRETDGK